MDRRARSKSPSSTGSKEPHYRACGCVHRFIPGEKSPPVRDRRRSRSRTSTNSIPRSRTPSSVSSGRTTPSPGLSARAVSEEVINMSPETPSPKSLCPPHCRCKYQVSCWLVPRSVPVQYSSTVIVQLGSTKRRYREEINFQKRLVPRQFSEKMEVATEPQCQRYTSEVTIPCQPPLVKVISLEAQQLGSCNAKQPLTTAL
ncbi:uncharacterized protein LOC110828059 isoform X2 [Zootermopsis nevadensis]|uniref:uncharacterized protein LOC110828059 isoform X2 n=1 Tax=Zootermopsis nevadensis TaxID=136037 RepID=UPI000B8E8C70|nr:uncharacterized protein LOC110828059 isoform X2 [Zootermopsis nevadensis]